jgi:hypothetical protein
MKKVIGLSVIGTRGEFEIENLGIVNKQTRDELKNEIKENGEPIYKRRSHTEEIYGDEVGYIFVEVEVGKGYELSWINEEVVVQEKQVNISDECGVDIIRFEDEDGMDDYLVNIKL